MVGSYHVIDLRESTQFTFNTLPHLGLGWLAKYYRIINATCQHFEGIFCSMLGDGTGVMYQHKDHASAAVLSCATILESLKKINFPLRGNAGVDSGTVDLHYLQTNHTTFLCPYGATIITAFRTEGIAPSLGHEVLITDATYQQLPQCLTTPFCFAGAQELKGIKTKIKMWGSPACDILKQAETKLPLANSVLFE